MENRFLNVSILQLEMQNDFNKNFEAISNAVDQLMLGYTKPELIVGVEFGICKSSPIRINGPEIEQLGEIAKKHGIYFIPGTMAEKADNLLENEFYNTCPIFGPDGNMIDFYRKKVPFRPGENSTPSQDDNYCIFEIKEKNIKIGVLICYDQFFPEIPRTLALKGAELIICPALDPVEYEHIPDIIPRARALENELYYIWTNGCGQFGPSTCCGKSTIVDPEGEIILQCGNQPSLVTKTLNFSNVIFKRRYGRDQHLNSLRQYNVKYPFANCIEDAQVYNTLGDLTTNYKEYQEKVKEIKMNTISSR